MFFKKKSSRQPGIIKRFFRSIFSVVILTAFVVGIAFGVQQIAKLDTDKLNALAGPVLVKVGLDEDAAGEVAGEFAERVSQTGINKTIQVDSSEKIVSSKDEEGTEILAESNKMPVARIALMADAHEDWDNFNKAINEAKRLDVDYIFYLGDFTTVGDIPNLEKGREILDSSGIDWEAIPGDHDLVVSADKDGGNGLENFLFVFEDNYKMITIADTTFLLFDNSANFTPLDEKRFTWFLNNISTADFAILSQPIYHSAGSLMMGVVEGEEILDINNQRKILLSSVQKSDVKVVFGGDHHQSSVSLDPENEDLKHVVVGAIASRRNFQTPRFMILNLYAGEDYDIEEILL